MAEASISQSMSTELRKVAERAQKEPEARFHALAQLIDVPALERAYRQLRKDAAVGLDGVTHEQYGQGLAVKLQDLHERMKSMRYRHQPIRRVNVPKDNGKLRPIGVAALEDKVVQTAIREVLEAVYEPVFLPNSYGFRPGRSAHDAVLAFKKAADEGNVNWVLEIDIESFFDSVDRNALMEMLRERVADGSMLRLVGKCLHVGVMEGSDYSEPEVGTTQGSSLSPLLGNIYLHHVLDLWFEEEVRPRLRGKSLLVRYADDAVLGFEREADARRVMEVLPQRMRKYGLSLNREKTRLVFFRRPSRGQRSGKGPGTFDFLGFTLYWRRMRQGMWWVLCKTKRASLSRAIQKVAEWCRNHRHLPVKEQHAALRVRVQGHFNYFGMSGNLRSLSLLVLKAERAWYYWLRRRSHKTRLNWERFGKLLKIFPLPKPRVLIKFPR